jgi:hypothetical protein
LARARSGLVVSELCTLTDADRWEMGRGRREPTKHLGRTLPACLDRHGHGLRPGTSRADGSRGPSESHSEHDRRPMPRDVPILTQADYPPSKPRTDGHRTYVHGFRQSHRRNRSARLGIPSCQEAATWTVSGPCDSWCQIPAPRCSSMLSAPRCLAAREARAPATRNAPHLE